MASFDAVRCKRSTPLAFLRHVATVRGEPWLMHGAHAEFAATRTPRKARARGRPHAEARLRTTGIGVKSHGRSCARRGPAHPCAGPLHARSRRNAVGACIVCQDPRLPLFRIARRAFKTNDSASVQNFSACAGRGCARTAALQMARGHAQAVGDPCATPRPWRSRIAYRCCHQQRRSAALCCGEGTMGRHSNARQTSSAGAP